MKLIAGSLLLIATGLVCTLSVNAQWTIENSNTNTKLNSIYLLDENSAWIVGNNGTIIHKEQEKWIASPKVTEENLYSVCFSDKNNGWAVGSKGTILRYDGQGWTVTPKPTDKNLYSVSLGSNGRAIAVGEMGTILVYDGKKWENLDLLSFAVYTSAAAYENLVLIGGGHEYMSIPVMEVTAMAGKRVVPAFDPGYIEIKSLFILNRKNIWAAGRPGAIFHYDGTEWNRLSQFTNLPSLNSIFFADANSGIAVGYYGTILTYSEGAEWHKEESPVKVNLNGAAGWGDTWYAVGNNGTIISLRRQAEPVNNPVKPNRPAIKIESYPNPPNEQLNIVIPAEDGFVADILTITGSNGRVIFKTELKSLTGGEIYTLDTSGIGSGLYLIQITSSSGTRAAGRFIVTR